MCCKIPILDYGYSGSSGLIRLLMFACEVGNLVKLYIFSMEIERCVVGEYHIKFSKTFRNLEK